MIRCELMIRARYILIEDENDTVIDQGAVVIDGKDISAVIGPDEIGQYSADRVADEGNSILMPGLVNTHTHAAMTFLRGLADDLPLNDWLTKHIWPAETKYLNAELVGIFSGLACLEMAGSGVTCFNDMYFFTDQTADAAVKTGIRALIGEAILDFPTASSSDPLNTIRITREHMEKYNGDELIKVAFAPHSVYACGRQIWEQAAELADRFDSMIHTHLCETEKEIKDCEISYGLRPIAYLQMIGALNKRLIAAHSIWLDDDELDICRDARVKIAHNPISNMKLASGIMPLVKMLNRRLAVGIGTDGAASNNTLDLWSDMRACGLLHKVASLNPAAASARELVRMATIGGAQVLGLEKDIGSLEKGKRADIISIDLDSPHFTPIFDPYSHLACAATGSDVKSVMVNGEYIMRDRQMLTVDKEAVIYSARSYIEKKIPALKELADKKINNYVF